MIVEVLFKSDYLKKIRQDKYSRVLYFIEYELEANSFKIRGINFGISHFYTEVYGLYSFLMCTYGDFFIL